MNQWSVLKFEARIVKIFEIKNKQTKNIKEHKEGKEAVGKQQFKNQSKQESNECQDFPSWLTTANPTTVLYNRLTGDDEPIIT